MALGWFTQYIQGWIVSRLLEWLILIKTFAIKAVKDDKRNKDDTRIVYTYKTLKLSYEIENLLLNRHQGAVCG